MLYYLFRFLDEFGIPGSHMWAYISFRSLLALILSLLISAWFGERFIKWMKRRNISETARDASIDPFGVEKKGVPTMGGIIIMVSILVPVILLGRMRNIYLLLMIVTTIWLGFLGFLGFAISTLITLPLNSFPLSSSIALAASSFATISTKPNPLLLPDSLSAITLADDTAPYWENKTFRSSLCTV